jgi:hypothetical protein
MLEAVVLIHFKNVSRYVCSLVSIWNASLLREVITNILVLPVANVTYNNVTRKDDGNCFERGRICKTL